MSFNDGIGGPLIAIGAQIRLGGMPYRNVVQFQMTPTSSHVSEARDELERWALTLYQRHQARKKEVLK
jgi:hypothetical protein